MEHISKHLTVVQTESSLETSKPLTDLNRALLPEEQKVLAVKYKSKPFGAMNQDELFVNVQALIVKLHVITGWNLPANEFLDILIDQMAKKLTESFKNVNADEMEFAFRNNSSVKDWGKLMNINLIDEVMGPYLEKRFDLSRIEEQKKAKSLPASSSVDVTDDEFIESVRLVYNRNKKWQAIPALAYDVLSRQKKINLNNQQKEVIKNHVSAEFEEIRGGLLKEYCKAFSVMLFFENKTVQG